MKVPPLIGAMKAAKTALQAFEGYDEAKKERYRKAGMAFFRAYLKATGLEGKVTYNKAGVAVAGDIRIVAPEWEAEICEFGKWDKPIMVRSRTVIEFGEQRRVSTGVNNWLSFEQFIEFHPKDIGVDL